MTDPLRARYWWHLVKQKNRTRQALREPTASLPSEQDGNVLHCTILSPFYYYNDFINRVLNDWCWERQPHNLSQGFDVVGASLRYLSNQSIICVIYTSCKSCVEF